ncbi:hypothetical protein EZV62_021721 [Acer yangbiense]|uniref:Serine carboxypeptidase-like 19 n=1 Tax=Acer yangbiense TaxID=1000413 RepID=A0A5C7H7S7_9ROSI|nr:hypothetical protein EZV62_021721 [Acer yangbiense]
MEIMAKLFMLFLILHLYYYTELAAAAVSYSSTVKFLPGFQGPLPFELETGYVGVDHESEDSQIFYYFVKSEKNPEEDPLILWLTGGPGCSAFSALLYEIGPLNFNLVEYNGSLPTLVLNPNSWTKVASILFVDLPVGAGFSYATLASRTGDFIQIHQATQFLRKGYILGNPVTESNLDGNSKIPFAHGMGLISDELCETYRYLLSRYWTNDKSVRKALHIRERSIGEWIRCNYGLNYTKEISSSLQYHVSLSSKGYRSLIYSGDHDMIVPFVGTQAWIRSLNYSIVDDWRPWNLHGQVAGYIHKDLLKQDDICNCEGKKIPSVFVSSVGENGAGHTAPEYKPVECYAMFSRWISHDPL